MEAFPPVSGIVFLPTGAGKTRIGIEHMARTLHHDPRHRFLWATYSRDLLRQTIVKLHACGVLFPQGIQSVWIGANMDASIFDKAQIIFMTRDRLTSELNVASDLRRVSPLRQRIERGEPTTLIYDECHQLGAEQLQEFLYQLHEKVLAGSRSRQHRWRVIGLSATPLPTRREARLLLQEHVFPPRPDAAGVPNDWGLHVLHKTSVQELLQTGILCTVNLKLDRAGIFDLPRDLLAAALREKRLKAPPEGPDRKAWMEYCSIFNSRVMTHPRILAFFAERLARHLPILGKCIVFVPNIDAANRLVEYLSRHPSLAGRVAGVHSKIGQLVPLLPEQRDLSVAQILENFRARGDNPCILVNVDMLTEGFDDPKVSTVVLARLTLSTNRFWQMIGRGMRGPATGGTPWCNVIDPIKLARLYDYAAGYQPNVSNTQSVEFEESYLDYRDGVPEPTVVEPIECAPLPHTASYTIDPVLRERLAAVAQTLAEFLAHAIPPEAQLLEVAKSTATVVDEQGLRFVPASAPDPATSKLILHEIIFRLSGMLGADLNWLHQRIPDRPDPVQTAQWLQDLARVRSHRLRTARAFDAAIDTEATGAPADSTLNPGPDPEAGQHDALALLATCHHLAQIDGVVDPSEVEVSIQIVCGHSGVPDGPLLRDAFFNSARRDLEAALDHLRTGIDPVGAKSLLKGWLRVARADQRIHPAERELLHQWAARLAVSTEYVEGLLDA